MCGVWLRERPHKQSAVNINKGILSRIKVSEQQYLKLRNYWTFLKPTTDTFTDKKQTRSSQEGSKEQKRHQKSNKKASNSISINETKRYQGHWRVLRKVKKKCHQQVEKIFLKALSNTQKWVKALQ